MSERTIIFKPNPNVIFRRLDGEIVLFHLDTDRFYELNGTAARFWELVNQGKDSAEIRNQLQTEYAVDAKELEGETAALVDSLRRENLITTDE